MNTLVLDDTSLKPEALSMPALMRELNLQQQPHGLLVRIMNALERKRQGKGLGWSRAWNKQGLNVFRTHVTRPEDDTAYLAPLESLLNHFLADAPPLHRDFVRELLADPLRMCFTFYHNRTSEEGRQYEGLTLSLGRKVPADRTKRDRLDVILEDLREDGAVDGLVDRIRIYVCPWKTYGCDRSYHLCDRDNLPAPDLQPAQEFYRHCVDAYNEWKGDDARQWSHWSVRYIDYFGPREFIPRGSSFI